MSQPPNPPAGGDPQQPGGWAPPPGDPGNWQSDPTQQLPTSPQYPPTQPLPAQGPGGYTPPGQYDPSGQYGSGQYGGSGQHGGSDPYGSGPSGQYGGGQYGSAGYGGGQYGAAGQYGGGQPGGSGQYGGGQSGAAGQYGAPGQYGPPGGNYPPSGGGYPPSSGGYPPTGGNYPPSGGNHGTPPPPSGGGGRNVLPVVIGVVAGVVVLGLAAWFLFFRPDNTATPVPSAEVSSPPPQSASATPSVLITPSAPPSTEPPTPSTSTSPSVRPSGTTSAACGPDLGKTQCEWAVYLRSFVQVDSCRLDDSDRQRDAFVCAANPRGKLKGTATVSMRWANDAKDLTGLMDSFFSRAGVAKNKLGKNWKNPPALTNWWYTDTPKQINGKLGSANAMDGTGRVAWTFSKQRFFIEAVSKGDKAATVLDWWART